MVIHIVIFKLIKNDGNSIEGLITELDKLKSLSFPLELTVLRKSNILKSYIDGDVVLYSKFKSKEGLNAYMIDHRHLEIIASTSDNIRDKYILDLII